MPEATTTKRDAGNAWLDAHARTTSKASRAGAKPKRPRRSAADLMRERDQHWFLLRLEGYTFREIAARSNVTHGTVLAAIKRIPESIKASLRARLLGTA